ncbi:MAG: citramalate synthase, partial [Eggerthellaceae bacterium]|nr:citramalate synthase [Eggerthellaceae bacterium]
MAQHIATYDCTLRDGEQAEGISFSLEDKLKIARRLDAFGIDYIEGGFPGSNPKDAAFFAALPELGLTHAKAVAFGPVCRKGLVPDADEGIRALVACGAPAVCVF